MARRGRRLYIAARLAWMAEQSTPASDFESRNPSVLWLDIDVKLLERS